MKNKSKTVPLKTELQLRIAASDARIKLALDTLQAHERGRAALQDFKRLALGPASGLDLAGMQALRTLTAEFAEGRREFLHSIAAPSPAEDVATVMIEQCQKQPCRYCGEEDCHNPSDCPVRRQHMAEDAEEVRQARLRNRQAQSRPLNNCPICGPGNCYEGKHR